MFEVMRQLHEDHERVARLLDLMDEQISAIQAAARADFELMLNAMHYILHYADEFHHPREEDKRHADEKLIVPRSLSVGNFKLCGVLLAYADASTAPVFKQAMGWNFVPNALGKRITEGIVELVLAKKIKPVIGRVVDFEQLPAAMEAMANRETVGRTIVKLY